jgi:hypothetical protein
MRSRPDRTDSYALTLAYRVSVMMDQAIGNGNHTVEPIVMPTRALRGTIGKRVRLCDMS